MKQKTRLGKTDSIFAKTTGKPEAPGAGIAAAAPVTSAVENKTTVILPPDQVAFLDRLAVDIRAKTGAKVRRSEIIRALVAAIMESRLDLTSCKDEDAIVAAVADRLKR